MRDHFTLWYGPFSCLTWTAPWSDCDDLAGRYLPGLAHERAWTYGCLLGFEVSFLWGNL